MPTRSSGLFSTGVPVRAQLRVRRIERTTSLVVPARFLIRWASSSTTRSNCSRVVRDDLAVAHQQLVVGDLHGHIGEAPLPLPPGLVPFDDRQRHLGRPHRRTRAASWSPAAWGRRAARCGSRRRASSSRIAVIACIVLPRPISSASTAAMRG